MTCEKVLLRIPAFLAALVCLSCTIGCRTTGDPDAAAGLYPARQVWAVAPMRNESGSQAVDAARVADHLARQLELAPGIDVLPVNRTLAAMEALGLDQVTDKNDLVVIATPDEFRIFVRMGTENPDVICCVCEFSTEVGRVVRSAQRLLSELSRAA